MLIKPALIIKSLLIVFYRGILRAFNRASMCSAFLYGIDSGWDKQKTGSTSGYSKAIITTMKILNLNSGNKDV